jgi:hypothetical protein
MEESSWIEYLKDRNVDIPKTGYVEIVDTFFGDSRRIFMDMSNLDSNGKILWNRAAPNCVEKYRFITEEEFLKVKILSLENNLKESTDKVEKTNKELEEVKKRLYSITTK